jgi:signal transduction histidine kinase
MPRVLIVDDEPAMRNLLAKFLAKEPFVVERAGDAVEAAGKLASLEFDVVVTDIILPGVSGIELLGRIKKKSPGVKVIVISGEPTVETAVEAVRLGAFDYLVKPVSRQAFISAVSSAARIKSLEDENRRYREALEQLVEIRTRQIQLSHHSLERKNELLELAVKQLEILNRSKSGFFATVSHELRTPLVALRGYLDLLVGAELGPLNDEQQRSVRIALENLARLTLSIESILTFSNLQTGKIEISKKLENIEEIITAAWVRIAPTAAKSGISLILDLGATPLVCRCDRRLLTEAFSNILDNAVKFNKPNGKVEIKAETLANRDIILVKDSGIGIAEDKLEKIFENFYKVDSSPTQSYGGVGLGLSNAFGIIKLHGGTIAPLSRVGEGTIMIITLPRESESEADISFYI